jgi:hypothetical protein
MDTCVVASCIVIVIILLILGLLQPTEMFNDGIVPNMHDVKVQFSYTDSININHREDSFKYYPRETLARNFATTFDERVRYIRVCNTGVCDPLASYVIDLSRINQRLPKGTMRSDRVYKLEEKAEAEEFVVPNDEFYNAITIKTVVHAYAPINTELTYSDIAQLVKNGLVEVFIQKPLQVKDNYMLQRCISATVQHQDRCERVEWSDDVNVPDVESYDPHLMVHFIPR